LQGIRCKECALENRPDYIDSRVKNDPEYSKKLGFLYLLEVVHPKREKPFYKIGITSRETPAARFRYSRYDKFSIVVMHSVSGAMLEVWHIERRIKALISSSGAALRPFCDDYWHWTESFEDVGGALLKVVDEIQQVNR
jgi:hypothetical protein